MGWAMSIGEGLKVESEQFARMTPTEDLRDGLAAWMARQREPRGFARGPTTI